MSSSSLFIVVVVVVLLLMTMTANGYHCFYRHGSQWYATASTAKVANGILLLSHRYDSTR